LGSTYYPNPEVLEDGRDENDRHAIVEYGLIYRDSQSSVG